MEIEVLIDIIALIPPLIGLYLLLRNKSAFRETKAGTAARINIYYTSAIIFDITATLTSPILLAGTFASLYLMLASLGFLAASLHLAPQSRSFKESFSIIIRSAPFLFYQATILTCFILAVAIGTPNLAVFLAIWAAATFYPTIAFKQAKKHANTTHAKDMLTILSASWLILATLSLPLILVQIPPHVLGTNLPYATQISLAINSAFFLLMSLAMTDPSGLAKLWVSHLAPQTIIELGKRYLILHDMGGRTRSFLSNVVRDLTESGTRIIVNSPRQSWLVETLTKTDPKFDELIKSGKIITAEDNTLKDPRRTQTITEKIPFRPSSTVYFRNLEPDDLALAHPRPAETPNEKGQPVSELLLLESSKAPRPQLSEFLKRNSDIQLLDLSAPRDYFSKLIGQPHGRITGSKILLEYDAKADLAVVEKFLQEGKAYAEKCVLFTSKSSKLYRAIKGRELAKVVVASSLVFAPESLPGNEVQIPDRELGLITSIVAEIVETNKTTAVRFVYDSIEDLIRGERWEHLYSGVKQIVELLNGPNITALFLVNTGTTDPKFQQAVRAIFPAQMKLDGSGLQAKKL